MPRRLTDIQELFAAKYVELGCSVTKAAKALGVPYAQAEAMRQNLIVQARVEAIIARASETALMSRAEFFEHHRLIIQRSLELKPRLHKGEEIPGHFTYEPGPALQALKQLAEEGFVADGLAPGAADDDAALTDAGRVAEIVNLCDVLRSRSAPEAPAEPQPKTVVRRLRRSDLRKASS